MGATALSASVATRTLSVRDFVGVWEVYRTVPNVAGDAYRVTGVLKSGLTP
jgi:hypothetical protein